MVLAQDGHVLDGAWGVHFKENVKFFESTGFLQSLRGGVIKRKKDQKKKNRNEE